MKISIREALFSGEEVDAWTPPKTWIIIKDFDDGAWTDEFCAIKGVPDREHAPLKTRAYVEMARDPYMNLATDSYIGPNDEYRYYYNESIDAAFYVTAAEFEKLGYDLDKILEYLESNPITDGHIQLKKVFGGKS